MITSSHSPCQTIANNSACDAVSLLHDKSTLVVVKVIHTLGQETKALGWDQRCRDQNCLRDTHLTCSGLHQGSGCKHLAGLWLIGFTSSTKMRKKKSEIVFFLSFLSYAVCLKRDITELSTCSGTALGSLFQNKVPVLLTHCALPEQSPMIFFFFSWKKLSSLRNYSERASLCWSC